MRYVSLLLFAYFDCGKVKFNHLIFYFFLQE